MGWFKRIKEGIVTPTTAKKETPEGLWHKCSSCNKVMSTDDHADNIWTCPDCGHHERINAKEYFTILFDDNKFTELAPKLVSTDPLNFVDKKRYKDRLVAARKKTGLNDAITCAYGKIEGHEIVIACMNFNFIGGSMGAVVGEKIARSIDHAIKYKKPFLLISKSGGARMMEAAFSLMQMAKTSAKLSLLAKAKVPYISFLTDPTTGGVTASYAMLGDFNIAEPKALIGFAGPRVVKETIKRDLPKDFQTSEFVLEHGFLDLIVERKDLKKKVSHIISLLKG
ncbi:MAG: acetyl-CoA carboxylase carboxyl transferase subunit beta [Saprospiraceae bacterium]|jgi:acetyl-CoA carboxylase carboxyl transferase subunit beta